MDNFDMNIVKTQEETDRKCPNCGAPMDFDPKTSGLYCPYCEYTEQISHTDDDSDHVEEQDFLAAEKTANCDWGVATKTVLCKSCGAESIYDALQTSAVCPFCDSNQVMEAADETTIAPGGVVPFKITSKESSELFHKWIKRKWFCPKLAKESAKPDKFKGIYLPYWTFDSDTISDYTARFGINRTTRDREGKSTTTTDWYTTRGRHREFINDEPVMASKNHNGHMLKGLEPFNTENNKPYKPEYVAGFVSERYSVGLKDAWEQAKSSITRKLTRNITDRIRREKNADSVRELRFEPVYRNIKYKYLMLPIWLSTFKYNDKVYQFMVNGETGKVSGKTPISIYRVLLAVGIGLLIIGGVFFLQSIL